MFAMQAHSVSLLLRFVNRVSLGPIVLLGQVSAPFALLALILRTSGPTTVIFALLGSTAT